MRKTLLLTLATIGVAAASAGAQTLPSLSDLLGEPAGSSTQPSQMLSQQESLLLQQLRFTGNTAFSSERLLDASLDLGVPGGPVVAQPRRVRDLVGKKVTLEELEQARVAVTLMYVNAGYINSGAVLDDQPVGDGAVVMRVIEGKLTDINITGNKRLRQAYLRPRIQYAGGPPLKLQGLRDELELLRQNPNIQQVNAELRPGADLGESALDVRVTENDTFELGLIFDNHRSPSVGAERVSAYVADGNLLGFSDSVRLQAALTDGGFDDFHVIGDHDGGHPFGEWPEVFFDYTIPISPIDTTLTLSYQKTDSTVFEEEFAALDIQSQLESYGVTIRQPIYRTPASEFAVFGTLNVKRNETFLLGEHFSFSPGSQDGESNSTVFRFGQEYFYRDVQQAVALRSSFTIGLDAFDSTVNSGGTADSQFWAWLGQAQYVRRLNNAGWQGVARIAAQLTDQSLLAIEQFSVGGVDTVRGYRENTFVRDNGIAASLELRVPLYSNAAKQLDVQLVPFFDIGYAYNHGDNPSYDVIESVGVGLTGSYTKHFSGQIFFGQQLNDVDNQSDDLQDIGIHFQFVARLF